MKRNLDYFVVLFVCLLISSVLYLFYDYSNEQFYSTSSKGIALRGVGRNVSMRGRTMQNSAISGGMMGGEYQFISSGRSQVPVSVPTHSYDHFRGLSTPVASSKSLLSSQVTHGSISGARVNVSGLGSSNFVQRSASALISQPNISMPVYAQSLKITSSSSARARSVSGADVDVARRSLVSSSTGASSSYFSSNRYNSYLPSVYGEGITLSRDGSLAYGTTDGRSRAKAQQRAPGSALSGSWGTWLDKDWENDGKGFGSLSDGVYWFDEQEARDAYEAQFGEGSSWNSSMGNTPEFNDFLNWLKTNNGKYRMPLGDIMPLCLIALAYMVMMFVRKRKFAK